MRLVALILILGFLAFADTSSVPTEDIDDELRIIEDDKTGEIKVLAHGIHEEVLDGFDAAHLKFKNREEWIAWKNRVHDKM